MSSRPGHGRTIVRLDGHVGLDLERTRIEDYLNGYVPNLQVWRAASC